MTKSSISFFVASIVLKQSKTLKDKLFTTLAAHENGQVPEDLKVDQVHAFNGMSGFNYWDGDDLVAQLYMGTLKSGTYVIYKRTNIDGELSEGYDYYDMNGNIFYNSATLDGQCVTYSSIAMDPTNPFTNHIYNILHIEYLGMNQNFGNTERIHFYESIVRSFHKISAFPISANNYLKDKALLTIKNEILRIEKDPILKWTERQQVFKQLKEVRRKILSTKRRAHGFNMGLYDFPIFATNIALKAKRYQMRPASNIMGTLYNNTIGKMLWFFKTVRENIGFSVAMAIYGPFTFYFITQPLNPHAMWAVGKVRTAYIETLNYIEPSKDVNLDVNLMGSSSALASGDRERTGQINDSVSTKSSAIKKYAENPNTPQDWDTRMSRFKAMQIAYEGDLVIAERLGRIEQFENQYNFSLTAEAAWTEMEAYMDAITGTLEFNDDLDKDYEKFLTKEKERTLELQLYIWQKMSQFFLDHPFQVVDQGNEQPKRDYYLGRQFVFFKKMTKKLQEMGMAKSPVTHKNIEMLANKFEKLKQDGASVLESLKKNSSLFRQTDYLSSEEHRDKMKRQWEVLYLQQMKKQEAASFSLQAYTWSVRNAMWILQSIYSTKRSELNGSVYKFKLSNKSTDDRNTTHDADDYLASMFNNLTMEYVSIKKELLHSLPGDTEAELRESVIENIKEYLVERDKVFNSSVFAAKKAISKNI